MNTQKTIKVQVITWNEFMNTIYKKGWIELTDFLDFTFYGLFYKQNNIYLLGDLNGKHGTTINL